MSSTLAGLTGKKSDAPAAPAPALTVPVPAFADISKPANDLINKDFYHALAANLEVKLKAPNGVSFTTKGTSPHESTISSSVEGKKVLANGISITNSWATPADALTFKVELDNTIAQGFKAEVSSLFKPAKGPGAQKLGLYFKQPMFHTRAFFDLVPGGNVQAVVDGVMSHEGLLVGGDFGYDVQKAAVSRYSAALGYSTPSITAALTASNNLSVFTASYYQKVNAAVEVATRAAYDVKTGSTVGLEVASKYKIDPLSFAKAKINDRGIASVAYNTKVNPGFTLGIGASFDTQKLNESGHKIGADFKFEA